MDLIPEYPKAQPLSETVAKSVAKDGAFSKPGSPGKWAPAKGVRFRSMTGKKPGRLRKNPLDRRIVKFY